MHDIKAIRANPDHFIAAMKRRGNDADIPDLIGLDLTIRHIKTRMQEAQSTLNKTAGDIGKLMREGNTQEADEKKTLVATMKGQMAVWTDMLAREERVFQNHMLCLPNVLADDVPEGRDEYCNSIVHVYNEGLDNPKGVPHYDLDIGFDFEAGVALAGSRFTVLSRDAARLHRALGQYMLDCAIEQGFEMFIPPLLVHDKAMQGTGQLPKFAEDAFYIGNGSHYLIPTAEVSLTNLVADQIIDVSTPIRMTALTPCFRGEAGSAGRDTRGFIRQHQFEKVELVTVCRPESAATEHEFLTRCAEIVLENLGLRYRRVLLCSGDTGFSAAKTYDLEVWMAGTKEYREISSCSNCSDFQARRMNTRYKTDTGRAHVHTLNGSALAVGRALVAVVEQYWDGERVVWPEALRKYK